MRVSSLTHIYRIFRSEGCERRYSADTGGLMQDHAPTIYAYSSLNALLKNEAEGGAKSALPGATGKPVTERPG